MSAQWARSVWGMMVICMLAGCATQLSAVPKAEDLSHTVAVGRVVVLITGERGRRFEPEVRSFDIVNRQTKERMTVEIESEDEHFVLPVIPGEYELSRVQISEGPFMSMAQLAATFTVHEEAITYVGTWRFGIDAPKYGRMVTVSIVQDDDDRARAVQFLKQTYPSMDKGAVATVLPDPTGFQTRLFEVSPYPRVSRYFRRHWW